MAIPLAESDYLSTMSFELQKNKGRTLSRFIVFNMLIYDSYMLLLSKEAARDFEEARNELNQLNAINYILFNLLDNYTLTLGDIRSLADLLKDDFTECFTRNYPKI